MDEHSHNIIGAINESFLGNEEKRILLEEFTREGPSDSFFVVMDTLLIDGLKKRGNAYEEVIASFESHYDDLGNKYEGKKGELDNVLNETVSKVDPINLAAKEKMFDQYYADIDTAQADYEKGLKELYAHLSNMILKK